MKKIFSILLAVVLMITATPLGAFEFKASADEMEKYFSYTVSNEVATITKVDTSISGDITIPSTLGGYPVTRIGNSAFKYCENLTSITIPNNITSIGDSAFYNCSLLTSVIIPDGVTNIGSSTFYNCSILTNITIPNSVTNIGEKAFYSCSSLTNITIPNSVTSIGYSAFYSCTSLTSINIPDSVTSIGNYAFSNTGYYNNSTNWENNVLYIGNHLISGKTSIYGSYNVKPGTITIAGEAFSSCSSLTSITIPDSVTSIGGWAFSYCSSLTSITIPDSVTNIGDAAFYKCTSLTSVTIPDSVTSIGYEAFLDCSSLTSINVALGNSNYSSDNGVLFNKNKITLICYPAGKTNTSYTIPDSVTRIDPYAFYNCSSLTSITIPNSVTSVGYYAFSYCDKLNSAFFLNDECFIKGSAFDSVKNLTIYANENSDAHNFALKNGYRFVDLADRDSKYTDNTLKLNYSFDKNNLELGDVINVGADYKRGNSYGMKYSGDIRWEISNPDVLKIERSYKNVACMYFKAVGMGSCDITLYLDGKEAISDTVTVGLSADTLLKEHSNLVFQSSAFSTLETARNTSQRIINSYSAYDRVTAGFFKNLGSGLGVEVITKEALAAFGLTPGMVELAEDKAVEQLVLELMNNDVLVLENAQKANNIFNSANQIYGAFWSDEDGFSKALSKITKYSESQIKGLNKKITNYSKQLGYSINLLQLTEYMVLLAQFELETIEDIRNATPPGSQLYEALNRLYEKVSNLEEYVLNRYLNETIINRLIEEIGNLGGSVYAWANLAGSIANMAYGLLGGLDTDAYLTAQASWGFAGFLCNYSLKNTTNSEKFERYYKYYVAATKASLKTAIDISNNAELTNLANSLYNQIGTNCSYDNFLSRTCDDLKNIHSISKETASDGKALASYGGTATAYSLKQTAKTKSASQGEIINIPAYIDGSEISGIADYGFVGATEVEGITLPQTIKTIGEYAFSNCSNVQYIHLNSGLTNIGNGAFYNCAVLEALTIPETVKTIGDEAFYGCEKISTLNFGEMVESIGSGAFENCSGLTTVYFENPNTVIPASAFNGLTNVTIYGYKGSTAETVAKECEFTFVAFEETVTSLEIITPATQTSVNAGETISTNGLTLKATYADGSVETVNDGWATFYNNVQIGEQLVKVVYKDAAVTYPITVNKAEVKDIILSDTSTELFVSDFYQLAADSELKYILTDLVWSSSNTSVATVSSTGYLTAVGSGEATITVSTSDGEKSSSCKVNVTNSETIEIKDGESTVISSVFTPKKSGYYCFEFEGVYEENVTAIIYNTKGEIITAGSGENLKLLYWLVTDEAYYAKIQGVTEAVTISIDALEIAESITLNTNEFSGAIGDTTKLTASFVPQNAITEVITWTSSDDSIASVDEDGNVSLLKRGVATITATSENGLTATCTITVEGLDFSTITLNNSEFVEVDYENPYAYFEFTPDEDGYYSFYSYDNDYDTYGYILDSNMEEIAQDDDSGEGSNFKVRCQLEVGVTYILKARFYNTDNNGSFKVCVEQTKYVTAMEVVSMPEKTEYIEGFVNEYNIDYYGLKLKVTWSDGSTTYWEYDYDWYVDGEYIYLDASNVHETGNVELTCGEASATLTFTIIKNPVDHIEILSGTEYSYIENYNGYIADANDSEFFCYDTHYPDDAVIKIVYTDGTFETAYVGDTVNGYEISWHSNQFVEPWVVGNNNKSTVSYLGHSVILPITVNENNVSSIVINSAPTREYIYGDIQYGDLHLDGEYELYPTDMTGLSFTVYYKDGTSKTFTHEDIDEYGNIDGFVYELNYDGYNPEIGDFPVRFTYMGFEAYYTVVLKESPVTSIEITKQPNKVSNWYEPDFIGMELTITYIDNSTKVITLTEDNLVYEYNPWWGELCYKVEVDGYMLMIERYYGEDEIYSVARYLGAHCDIKDITINDDKEIDSIELNKVSWNGDGMIVKVTYTDESTETLVIDVADFFDFGDSSGTGFGMTQNGLLYYDIETDYDINGRPEEYRVFIFNRQITVKVDEIINGDTNGDSVIDLQDVTLFSQYLAGWDVDVNDSALDVDGDGLINLNDLIHLAQYVAGWEGIELH